MKFINKVSLCAAVLFACSTHVFAGVRTLDTKLFCGIFNKSDPSAVTRQLKDSLHAVSDVKVEEHMNSRCCFFKHIKYVSLESRNTLVNKCVNAIGPLTKAQLMNLDFYVFNESYVNKSNYGFFKLKIDEEEATKETEFSSSRDLLLNHDDSVNYSNDKTGLDESYIDVDTTAQNAIVDDHIQLNIMNIENETDEAYSNTRKLMEFGDANYEGEMDGNLPHGKGILKYKKGGQYEGDFRYGKRDGKGTLSFSNGREYVGEFKDDKYHGQGIMTYPSGCTHNGLFENGKKHGFAIAKDESGNEYKGNFKKGKRHGQGTLTYANGNIYEGMFENGKMHGQGTLTYANGDIYEGMFENGEKHGQAVVTSKDGIKCKVMFKNGQKLNIASS